MIGDILFLWMVGGIFTLGLNVDEAPKTARIVLKKLRKDDYLKFQVMKDNRWFVILVIISIHIVLTMALWPVVIFTRTMRAIKK